MLHDTCGKCLTADESCSWCISRNYDMRKPRCLPTAALKQSGCEDIYENRVTKVELIDNQLPHDFEPGSLDAIQIQPQRVKLTLRKCKSLNMI